jgi:nucleotide-binding universal stress UspA family protein
VLGASERHRGSDVLFSPLVDTLVRLSPAPTMVVQGPRQLQDWTPERILVPVTGTVASRHAAELAFALARPGQKCVLIMNVVEQEEGDYDYREAASAGYRVRQHERAQQIVGSSGRLGGLYEVQAETLVEEGRSPDETILEVAEREKIST